jgi:formamidopyrimidine-DNA glycosylase
MPELPEVESVARTLRPLVRGKTIRACDVLHRIAVKPQRPAHVRRALEGRRIEEVERRGKYLALRLDKGCAVLHFKLDGRLVWFDPPEADVRGHIDVALRFDHGTLGFVDRRHFGRVHWHAKPEDVTGIRTLGIDPLSRAFTPEALRVLLAKSRRPIKLWLIDQTRLAGLGNIYSSESLWHARISPRRPARRVTAAEARRLHKAIVAVLQRALKCCLAPAPDFRDAEWWFQGLEKVLRVYGREGKPCARCGTRIRRIEQGGRSSYYCPSCQR